VGLENYVEPWPRGHPALVQHNFHDPPAIFPKEYDTQWVKTLWNAPIILILKGKRMLLAFCIW